MGWTYLVVIGSDKEAVITRVHPCTVIILGSRGGPLEQGPEQRATIVRCDPKRFGTT